LDYEGSRSRTGRRVKLLNSFGPRRTSSVSDDAGSIAESEPLDQHEWRDAGSQAVIIIAVLYLILLWLLFSKLKLVRLGWLTGIIAGLIGALIIAVFLGLLNYLTPSGRLTVTGRVVEVIPNVAGQVIAIPVVPNVSVKAGAVLFQIDPVPFRFKVMQAEAALAASKQQAEQLKANYQQASATVEGLVAQLAFNTKRLSDMQTLARQQAATEFREQDVQVQQETVAAQLQAAKAAQLSAKLALDSEINGVNTSVIQNQASLDNTKWELDQTTVRAPSDGYVTVMALAVGDRALPARAAMSFIVTDEIMLIGMFAQNGFQTIKRGTAVKLVFDDRPGQIYPATITDIPRGVGQGQIAVSGTLARTTAIGGASTFPAQISIPADLERDTLRLGMSGTATAFAENAGVIGILASILLWVSAYAAYL
jgi:multidrug resistance efflux pump